MIRDEIQKEYKKVEENIYTTGSEGYWSNLNKDENDELINDLESLTTEQAVNKHCPNLFNIIFSPKRVGGLELLELSGNETCVDYGCMWGALTLGLAKRCQYVLGVDQTMNSLRFLNKRLIEERLGNVDLLCSNLKDMKELKDEFDVAILNGVLEWIPEEGTIELKAYYGKFQTKEMDIDPRRQQLDFLKKAYQNLKSNGKLYLAIENRFDFKMFLGVKDPHANTLFTTVVPRKVANWMSLKKLGRPYVNWIYSFRGITTLLKSAGFSTVDMYMCFPDYRFPEKILPYEASLKNFMPTISTRNAEGRRSIKRILARITEVTLFRYLRARYLAPSIIAIGHK